MKAKDWEINHQLELKYKDSLYKVMGLLTRRIEKAKTTEDVHRILNEVYNSTQYHEMCAHAANRMVTAANTIEATTWREAAKEATKSRLIFDVLKKHLDESNVGKVMRAQIQANANYIKTLPLDVAQKTTAYVARETLKGRRSSDIAKDLKGYISSYARARANLIARTETSKTVCALTEARSKDIGVKWYVWKTANDGLRVRHSHRIMKDVIVKYDDPPAPEELAGEKSAGHYNAGNIYNCRCYPRPLINLDTVSWPAKVYYHGSIQSLTRGKFEAINRMHKGDTMVKIDRTPKKKEEPKVEQIIENIEPIAQPKEEIKEVIQFVLPKTLEKFAKHQEKFFTEEKLKLFGPEDKQKEAIDKVKTMAKNSVTRSRIDQNILKLVLNDGRFKTQMEVGASHGTYDPQFRQKATKMMFGVNAKKLENHEFEYYGYLWNEDAVDDINNCGASQYGGTIVQFKPDIRKRTTFTIGDSLGPCTQDRMLPTELENPETISWRTSPSTTIDIAMTKKKEVTPKEILESSSERYVEAQYHGGVTVDDIEQVIIGYDPKSWSNEDRNVDMELVNMLKERGIKVGSVNKQEIYEYGKKQKKQPTQNNININWY